MVVLVWWCWCHGGSIVVFGSVMVWQRGGGYLVVLRCRRGVGGVARCEGGCSVVAWC